MPLSFLTFVVFIMLISLVFLPIGVLLQRYLKTHTEIPVTQNEAEVVEVVTDFKIEDT